MSACEGNCSCAKRKKVEPTDSEEVWMSDGDEEHFTAAIIDQDDIFKENDESMTGHVNTLSLKRSHFKQGYIEGIAVAKAKSTQKGFDEGYFNGSGLGLKVGEIISGLNFMRSCDNLAIREEAEKSFQLAKTELNITNVLKHSYFDKEINLLDGTHQLVLRWEEIMTQLYAKFYE